EVAGQSVRDVEHRARQPAQGESCFGARLWALKSGDAFACAGFGQGDAALQMGESERGAPWLAGDPDVVVSGCARARDGAAGWSFAENRHAQIERPARGVAADQVDTEGVCA